MTYVYKNENNSHCPVYLFEKYVSLCPKISQKAEFYLHPMAKPMPWQWFMDKPIGINALCSTVKRLAEKAGLQGKFSNHSLCTSSATRLFQGGVPEKVIKEITGHRSDCVHEYEQTLNNLKCKVSATLGKAPDIEVPQKIVKTESKPVPIPHITGNHIATSVNSIVSSMDPNTVKNVSVKIDFQFGGK